jgi:hypothetical protein
MVVDTLFRPFVHACGKNLDKVTLGLLTGPHVWKLGVELSKGQAANPLSVVASLATAVGYGAFARYLSLHHEPDEEVKTIKKQIVNDLRAIDNLLHWGDEYNVEIKQKIKTDLERLLLRMTEDAVRVNISLPDYNGLNEEQKKMALFIIDR